MWKRLLKNTPAKIVAFLAACVLWMHVATEQKYEHIFNLPLSIEGLPAEYVLGAPLPDSVGVVLKGRGKDLIKLLFSEGAVVIDGRGFKYSERFMDLTASELVLPDNNYELISYTRTEPIRLVIDRYSNLEVPVESNLVLEAADGFEVIPEKTTFEPSHIVIGGPERLVRSIESVKTQADTFRNLNAGTNIMVDIEREFTLLEYTPTRISAKIVVEPLVNKKINAIPIEIKGLRGSDKMKLDQPTIDIVFAGVEEVIDSLTKEDIHVFVDFVEGEDRLVRPVIIHPPNVHLVSTSPETFGFVPE